MDNDIPYLDLLCNVYKMHNKKEIKETSNQQKKNNTVLSIDDNKEIMKLIESRLKVGKNKYDHGVIVDENVTKYGTIENDWQLKSLEEIIDSLIYTSASIIRYRRCLDKRYNDRVTNDDSVIKYRYKI